MGKFYAGIGSRETPMHIQEKMTEIASILERRGYTLRTGYAIGADQAFGRGTLKKEVFNPDDYYIKGVQYKYTREEWAFAERTLKKYHPAFQKGGNGIKSKAKRDLLARNTFQIFGVGDATKNSEFVIGYTPDGAETTTTQETGGTGQAIRISNDYDIPVYNLKNYIGVTAEEMVNFILNDIANKN